MPPQTPHLQTTLNIPEQRTAAQAVQAPETISTAAALSLSLTTVIRMTTTDLLLRVDITNNMACTTNSSPTHLQMVTTPMAGVGAVTL